MSMTYLSVEKFLNNVGQILVPSDEVLYYSWQTKQFKKAIFEGVNRSKYSLEGEGTITSLRLRINKTGTNKGNRGNVICITSLNAVKLA